MMINNWMDYLPVADTSCKRKLFLIYKMYLLGKNETIWSDV